MGLFGSNKSTKSWQRLSFGHRRTRTAELQMEQDSTQRLLRLVFVALHAVGASLLIGFSRLENPLEVEGALSNWLELFGAVFLVHGGLFLLVRAYHSEEIRRDRSFARLFLLFDVYLVTSQVLLLQGLPPMLVPLPMLGMVLGLVFSAPLAIHACGAGAILTALMIGPEAGLQPLALGVTQFLGALVAVQGVQRIRTRTRLVTIGAVVGLTEFFAGVLLNSTVFGTITLDTLSFDTLVGPLRQPMWGLADGLLAGVVVTSALPFLERLFDVTTDMRLFELADTNLPLLHQFSLLAPGSFQHSMMVGQLAEEAAQSIRANSLLCRVGALYHDIGKMMKPGYFVENMTDGLNIHDRLSPEMSRLVVIAHVKDGVRIACEEKLPQPIIDMIPMHHGTSVVEFFFNKKMQQGGEEPERTREAFRYPGPKPTFREAGIMMLADSVEASSRTLIEPTPTRIRAHVKKIIHSKMTACELDECDLTMRDLHSIEDAFVRVLSAIHHGRIRYPGEEEPPAAKEENSGGVGKGVHPGEEAVETRK
ncbi:MAG TPA: HDIG domain-containing protein [Planctomycetes bacterium]|nr:HDIG domain-containing protein [Planctomycetota bacterium]